MSSDFVVSVLGAGGHTGRFVVERLVQKGITVLPATRSGRFVTHDRAELCRSLDFARPESLDAALAGADAVINCAGPFFDTAEPAALAALRARIPYLDVMAEQSTAARLFETLDGPARKAGVPIVPAMAFFGGLADMLVSTLVQDSPAVDTVDIAVGLDGWHPTAGTRLTGQRNLAPRQLVRDGALVPVPSPPPARSWSFPEPLGEQAVTCVPLSEIILIARHVEAAAITSYMNLKPLDDLHDARTPPPQAVDAQGRSAQRFVMDVAVTSGSRTRRATATGVDIYAVSAPLIVEACLQLLEDPTAKFGVRAPGEILDPTMFFANLKDEISVRHW